MDIGAYRRYLEKFVLEALEQSDGTNAGISRYLWEKKPPGFLSRHRHEKQKALAEARNAFDDHRHWPVEIVLSHLGISHTKQAKT